MVSSRWKSGTNSIYNVGFHLIWCPKYRYEVLVGFVEARLKELLKQKAVELKLDIERLEVMPDHVHLFIKCPTTIAPNVIVKRLKGYTSRVLRQEFGNLNRLPSLWTNSYYCESIGHISEETIKRYIEEQKTK